MRALHLWIPLWVLLIAGCAANVTYDYDPGATRALPGSFAFLNQDRQGINSLDDRRIQDAIRRELTAKGLEFASKEQAATWVDYKLVDSRRYINTGFSYGFGFGWRHSLFGLTTYPEAREVQETNLIVELIDPRTQQVIWRAASRRNLARDLEPRERTELVNEVVQEMFSNYPPSSGN